MDWPSWWIWDLEFTSHLLERMVDRGFTEVDLRVMLEKATGLKATKDPSRFLISTRWQGQPWELVVEPDEIDQVLLIITAYPVE
jgi:hypothetical protein